MHRHLVVLAALFLVLLPGRAAADSNHSWAMCGYRSHAWPVVQAAADTLTYTAGWRAPWIQHRARRLETRARALAHSYGLDRQPAVKAMLQTMTLALAEAVTAAEVRDTSHDMQGYHTHLARAWRFQNRVWGVLDSICP